MNGGYNFPGGDSSIDLYSLTGWIPERILLHKLENADDRDHFWEIIYNGMKYIYIYLLLYIVEEIV